MWYQDKHTKLQTKSSNFKRKPVVMTIFSPTHMGKMVQVRDHVHRDQDIVEIS